MLPTIFNYGSAAVRTVEQGGEVCFYAKDVCDVLGLKDVGQAISRLDEDEACLIRGVDSLGSPRCILTIYHQIYSTTK